MDHPLHDRQIWTGKFFEWVPPNLFLQDEIVSKRGQYHHISIIEITGILYVDVCIPIKPSVRCFNCNEQGCLIKEPTSNTRIVVNLNGKLTILHCK